MTVDSVDPYRLRSSLTFAWNWLAQPRIRFSERPDNMTDRHAPLTYVSLFSSAGLGCYGFKQEGYLCLATAELLKRRIAVQQANDVCADPRGYIVGDITDASIKGQIFARVAEFELAHQGSTLTAVLATPPCQGMSVANHKKNNELPRNSLVIESIQIIKQTKPKFFVLENVRSFLSTTCLDVDGKFKPISDAIDKTLLSHYSILKKIVNLKDYGSPSSRTRTLVIGVRRDLTNITPLDIFPTPKPAATLQELISHLPRLEKMEQTAPSDPFHAFRPYDARMRPWIHDLKPGENAFMNVDRTKRPHRIIGGEYVANKAANGDKYRRNRWDAIPPCVHTRNDILASQSTVHPEDDRVFSIRELMLMMGVPKEFKWFTQSSGTELDYASIRAHEPNIRQCLGEGVPTPVFRSIAHNFSSAIATQSRKGWGSPRESVAAYIDEFDRVNPRKRETAAYYTRQDIAFDVVSSMPNFTAKKSLRILEPSVGSGAFLPALFARYPGKQVHLDLVDIDPVALARARTLADQVGVPPNVTLNFICADFLALEVEKKYDAVVGNPPFGPVRAEDSAFSSAFRSSNLYTHFLEKALAISSAVSLIIPKSFASAPTYSDLRHYVSGLPVTNISDYGEEAFVDIKIETIGLHVDTTKKIDSTRMLSYPLREFNVHSQRYLMDSSMPSWLFYRDTFFDSMLERLELGLFTAYRDRTLSKKHRRESGDTKLLRGRNIGHGAVLNFDDDAFISAADLPTSWFKIAGRTDLVAVPNLSYYPRAVVVPDGYTVDGSAAVLVPVRQGVDIHSAVAFFSSEEFFHFYRIARNYSTRSLNVDSVAAFYWGVPRVQYRSSNSSFRPRVVDLFKKFSSVDPEGQAEAV